MLLTFHFSSLGYCILIAHGYSVVLARQREGNDVGSEKADNGSAHHNGATSYEKEEEKARCPRKSRTSCLLLAALVLLISSFVLRTVGRNKVWKNREALFR